MKDKVNKFGEKAFFAAANSGRGFYSFYPEIFENGEIRRRYILKGGPGTGKSRFIREIASRAASFGMDTELYYCSSDPTSLDGVVIDHPSDGRICIVDGTAPHTCNADIPGARDEIIDLGRFWSRGALTIAKDRILKRMQEKKSAYARADECLRAALEITLGCDEYAHEDVLTDKLDNATARLLSGIDADEFYFERVGLQSSFGMFGEYSVDTYAYLCEDLIIVDDSMRIADAYLSSLARRLRRLNVSSYRSYSCREPHRLDAIFIPSMRLSVIADTSGICAAEEKCRKRINMQRFVDKDDQRRIKQEIKNTEKAVKELKRCAENEMERMRRAHFELESIYVSAMDFDAKERFCEKWIEENI